MSNFDLLDTVLPTEGRYCVVGIGKYVDQKFFDTREEVTNQANHLVKNQFDVYFGCAKFGTLNNRTHENAKYFRALWMDIDCGPTKGIPNDKGVIQGYLDQATGLKELKNFCKTIKLPRPILVSSGNGIHAYWLLEETIPQVKWKPLANRFRELCVEHGLIVDPSVFEASRVLRIPGTFNFKREPLPIEVLNEETPRLSYAQIKELLGAPDPKPEEPDFIPRSISPMMEALMSNKVKRFKTIMMKSVKGDGCNQLLHCFENQENLSEPMWRSALSITAFCIDGNSASHKMSNKHPEYEPSQVEEKIENIRKRGGPHHCTTFEKQNPGGCDSCAHKGKIKSPIVLGTEIEEADDEDNTFVANEEVVQIPEYPFPYFRGKNGGVYRRGDEDEGEPTLVYEHDFYVVKRMRHAEFGELALMRLHLPQDGVKEFAIPATSIVVKDKLREAIAHHGVVPTPKQMDQLMYYTTAFIKNLQYQKKAEIMRTQFGWVEGDSKFILGEREITKDGAFYSPPSTTIKAEASHMHPVGSIEKWKEVFNMYAKPGLEPHAFAALTAFGSPLLKFTGLKGAIINVIHSKSGSGKSTALYMCNSVVGHPQELSSIWKDTMNSKMHRLGVMNNLANTIDEITNTSPIEFSDLAYSISQGRGKNRMKSQANEMRINNTSWQGITLASSNASFYEKLGAAKDSPDGESMRLLEYKIEPNDIISVSEGKHMFDHQLLENYGHAGEPYIQWLVNNLEDAKMLMLKVQARLDKEVKFTSRERFWSAVVACNIAGGLISKSLGLHDYDMKQIYDWVKVMLSEMRHDVKPPQTTPLTTLGEFINVHINNALVVNGEIDARSNLAPMPFQEPKGELLIRYEPDTKELYIAAKQFKDFCVKQQINYKGLMKELGDLKIYTESMNKRMSKGMRVVSPPVRVLKFDTSGSEFLQLEAYAKPYDNRDGAISDQLEKV